ncbi:hypothetical protein [Arcobacter aquimarinus]|uniref:hypothetical protein n=1 Tax=Arcobacter aquimarinus TaxID=1315211 RepID=UPI003BAE5DE8
MSINKFWLTISILTSCVSFYFFIFSGGIFFFSDVYAYLSYAQNLYNLGFVYDITTIPTASPNTPQIGIVLIYAFLRFFTEDMINMVKIVIAILTINLIFIYYLIFKIGKILEIRETVLRIFILSLSLSFYYYYYYIQPINDGFYISLFLLSIYIILKIIQNKNELSRKYWIYLFLISITIPLFRLQGMIEIIASIIVFSLVQKNYKKAFFSFLLLISAFISVRIIVYFFINDFTNLKLLTEVSIFNNFSNILISIKILFGSVIPSMYFNKQIDYVDINSFYIISIMIFSCTIFIFFKSFINRDAKIFFLVLIIIGNYGALILFNVMIDRYIYINATLLSLIILYYLNPVYKVIFAILLLFFSLFTFYSALTQKKMSSKEIELNIEYLKENYKDYNLISPSPRQFYFYLNKPSTTNLEYINKNLPIIIIGYKDVVENLIKNLREKNLELSIRKIPLNWQLDKWMVNVNVYYETYEINILKSRKENEN